MAEITIGPDTRVTLHFAIKLQNGDVVDSTFDKAPATFTVGDGNLLPGFEQALFGLEAGTKTSLTIPPERGFGQPNDGNLQTMARDDFSDMELSPGLLIIFSDAAGGEMPGVVKSYDDEQVIIDFNHPLAGRVLTFDVEILAIEPAVSH
ncbi:MULTISPECIES: FKBP-type peptidyl-prolyl cis-trans isomerase [Pseudomonadaceae]|jgi:FKBP-type peptidyl-prolyl cis-trans isomerase SlpA|uniref:Peptidyl-prolyl cis-trans isomerase n=2 Tax=Pseudomonadaceae TaxID=135621 RepID=A0ABX3IX00_9PSED|nr:MULTISPECIES: peptidylprolyl isomerase [Pseudomonas]HCV77586.1 peptidylprolyl isomerase [Pseudomonas sp.]EHK70757.1 FKBP-type peptidyl-prolyl cis-trans isomerase SlpA [Pseudomonas psychrotolerans L19]KIZ51186.1 peptidylprolyl isomerase [Pseudomonas oryzihabitans]KTT53328.1 peptidylprolyl isomerase [Pseudomonas psychrotolerans]KXJ32829.1 peptidylprolyl isomerase [Pseudomonas sp. HUK17]